MYYMRTVLAKLSTPDDELRRAERHHQRQRAAKKHLRDQA
jgi:hypothetical protein